MNTYTFNRNYISNDLLFVAACGRTCADLFDSRSMDAEISTETSLYATLKRAFLGK